MKSIIVDTNIVFSCLLNTQGIIGDILFNSDDVFIFYCPEYLRTEIYRHWPKLLKISKLTDKQLRTAYDKLLAKLHFIGETLVPHAIWEKAAAIVADIDEDDVDFVAITRYLKGAFWTGDKRLHEGLKAKRFRTVYNTSELFLLRNRMLNNNKSEQH